METMLSAIAQFENEVKADRTKAGMQSALESGRWTFGAPLGYIQTGGRGSQASSPIRNVPHMSAEPSICSPPDRTRSTMSCAS